MTKIVFVCTGNACRSPLAECILKHKLAEANITGVEVTSVGTCYWGRHPRDEKMVDIAFDHGYRMSGETTFMTAALLDDADYVIIMSPVHRDAVTSVLQYSHWDRIVTFRQCCFGEDGGVTDPSGGTLFLYQKVFDIIEQGCVKMVERLKTDGHLL